MRVFSRESSLNTGSWIQTGHDIIGEANMAMSLGILFPFPTMAKPSLWVPGQLMLMELFRVTVRSIKWMIPYQVGYSPAMKSMSMSMERWHVAYDHSGFSVSLSANGKKVAIHSPFNDDKGDASGHVWVFVLE